jgi:hypothetical protein
MNSPPANSKPHRTYKSSSLTSPCRLKLLRLEPIIWLRFAKLEIGLVTAPDRGSLQSLRSRGRLERQSRPVRRLIGSASGSKRRARRTTARLFGLLWPLTIAESHTRTAAVLVDEFDARHFARSSLDRSAIFFAGAAAGGYLLATAQGQSVEINFRRACTHDIGDDAATTAGLGPAIRSLPYIEQQIL